MHGKFLRADTCQIIYDIAAPLTPPRQRASKGGSGVTFTLPWALHTGLSADLRLQCIVFLAPELYELGDSSPLLAESRFVCIHQALDYNFGWLSGAVTGDDYWALADAFLAARRAGTVWRSQYMICDTHSYSWRELASADSQYSINTPKSGPSVFGSLLFRIMFLPPKRYVCGCLSMFKHASHHMSEISWFLFKGNHLSDFEGTLGSAPDWTSLRLDEQYGFQRTITALLGKRQDGVNQFRFAGRIRKILRTQTIVNFLLDDPKPPVKFSISGAKCGESYASTDDCKSKRPEFGLLPPAKDATPYRGFHTRYGVRRGGSGDHQDFVRLGGGPRGWPTWKSGERAREWEEKRRGENHGEGED
ncbi:hypothetical protein B0H14DRAFT_3726671 [Mycena olivaceomarginata]|nr:hypothetical protein B0H14DRAFT_3726671 [Mycena olivaceomarginata]